MKEKSKWWMGKPEKLRLGDNRSTTAITFSELCKLQKFIYML